MLSPNLQLCGHPSPKSLPQQKLNDNLTWKQLQGGILQGTTFLMIELKKRTDNTGNSVRSFRVHKWNCYRVLSNSQSYMCHFFLPQLSHQLVVWNWASEDLRWQTFLLKIFRVSKSSVYVCAKTKIHLCAESQCKGIKYLALLASCWIPYTRSCN